MGCTILYHIVFGPIALVWDLLVAIFGKRLLKRMLFLLMLAGLLVFALVLVVVLFGSKPGPAAAQANRTTPPATGSANQP